MDQPIVRARTLTRHYPVGQAMVPALDGVDLSVRRGEFVALVGPSGSGKSTLLNLIGGLDRPSQGEVWVSISRSARPTTRNSEDSGASGSDLFFKASTCCPP